jgi:hypothetical protein
MGIPVENSGVANLRVIYDNFWRSGTMLGASSENPQYPAENTQDDDTSFVWRSAAGALTPTIDVDLGSAKTYDYVGLFNHNFTSAATIQIKGADDAAFTVNVVTDTLTYNGNNLRGFLAAPRQKRYVRAYIQDAANPSNYIQIGTVVLGKYVDLGSARKAEGYEEGPSADSELDVSASGNEYTVQERDSRDTMAFSVRLSDTARVNVKTMISTAQMTLAIDFVFDYTAPNISGNAWWARLITINRPAYSHVDYWTWDAEIKKSA